MLSSYGVTTYYQPSSLGADGIMFSGDIPRKSAFAGLAGGLITAEARLAPYAKDNNVAVVSATYLIDFAAAGGHESISSASVTIGQNLAVTQGSVKFLVGHTSSFNNGVPTVALGQPIESGKQFGEVMDETTATTAAVQEAANILSILSGSGTNRSRNYVIKADPEKFAEQTLDVVNKAGNALLAKAKAE